MVVDIDKAIQLGSVNIAASDRWFNRAAKFETDGDQEKADRFLLKALAAEEREQKEGSL